MGAIKEYMDSKSHNQFWKDLWSNDFDEVFGSNAKYVEYSNMERFKTFGNGKLERNIQYAKYLEKLIEEGVKLVIAGGHSMWFQHFVDVLVTDTDKNALKMKNDWGTKNKKRLKMVIWYAWNWKLQRIDCMICIV